MRTKEKNFKSRKRLLKFCYNIALRAVLLDTNTAYSNSTNCW